VSSDLWVALVDFMAPPAMTAIWRAVMIRVTGGWSDGWACVQWVAGALLIALADFAAGFRVPGLAAVASAVFAVLWWWHRRKGRRVLSLLAGKYKYIRDAMVRVMKERGRTRPVLRPAPGPAQ